MEISHDDVFHSGLIACLGLVSALFVLLIVFLRKNWNHACKSRLSFLAPILLVAVISYLSVTILVPMVFDFVQLVNRQYDVREIDIPDEAIPQNHSLILMVKDIISRPVRLKPVNRGVIRLLTLRGHSISSMSCALETFPIIN